MSYILSCQLTKVNEVPLRVVEGWKHDDLHRETIYIAVVLLLASIKPIKTKSSLDSSLS